MRLALLCAALEFGSRRCAVDLTESEAANAPVARTADETPAPVAESAEGEYSIGEHATEAGRGPWTKQSNSTRLKGSRKDPVDRQEFHHMHAAMPAPAPLRQAAELELGGTEGVEGKPWGISRLMSPSSSDSGTAASANETAALNSAEALLDEGKLGTELGLSDADFKTAVQHYKRDVYKDGVLAAGWTAWSGHNPTEDGFWAKNIKEDGSNQTKLQRLETEANAMWGKDGPVIKEILNNLLWQKAGNEAMQFHSGGDHFSDKDKADIHNISLATRGTLTPTLKTKIAPALNKDLLTKTLSMLTAQAKVTSQYITDMLQYVYLKTVFSRYINYFETLGKEALADKDLARAEKMDKAWTSAKKKIEEVYRAYKKTSDTYNANSKLSPIKDLQALLFTGEGGKYKTFMKVYDEQLNALFTAVKSSTDTMNTLEQSLSTKHAQETTQVQGDIQAKGAEITQKAAAYNSATTVMEQKKREAADLDTQIQSLQTKVQEKKAALITLKEKKTTMDAHAKKVAALSSDLATIQQEHTRLQTSVGHR